MDSGSVLGSGSGSGSACLAEGEVVHGHEDVRVVREVLEQPRRAIEAAAQAAVRQAAQGLRLALAVALRLVQGEGEGEG